MTGGKYAVNPKCINSDNLDDKLALDKPRFLPRVNGMLYVTSVNRDNNDILQPTPKLMRKRTQSTEM
jgi:hypothetical protein